MSAVRVDGDVVRVELTRAEKVAGFVRDQEIPLASVHAVDVIGDPMAAPAGIRAPGLEIPGRRTVGTWRAHGRREFVCIRRGEPAVELIVHGERYDRYLLGTPDAHAIATRIAADLVNR